MKKSLLFSLPLFITACNHGQQAPESTELNVCSFNIRYDNSNDGLNRWSNRKDAAAGMIRFYDLDVVGTQEVLHHQLQDLMTSLPAYASVGVGREDGLEKGEYSALLYKKDKFDLVSSGNFWLSETPQEAGSKGWDAACERIVTWAALRDKKSDKLFYAFNTHFDHEGQTARSESVALLLNSIDSIAGNHPVFVTGDFNAEPTSSVILGMTDAANPIAVKDSRAQSSVAFGPAWTFHDFGRLPMERREIIDYIFVKNNVAVNRYGIVNAQLDSMYLTDHNPVLVNISLK